jgi:hypothetical protein
MFILELVPIDPAGFGQGDQAGLYPPARPDASVSMRGSSTT